MRKQTSGKIQAIVYYHPKNNIFLVPDLYQVEYVFVLFNIDGVPQLDLVALNIHDMDELAVIKRL